MVIRFVLIGTQAPCDPLNNWLSSRVFSMVKEENASSNLNKLDLSDTPDCFTNAFLVETVIEECSTRKLSVMCDPHQLHYAESQCNRFIYKNKIESYLLAPYKNQQIFT